MDMGITIRTTHMDVADIAGGRKIVGLVIYNKKDTSKMK
jgi:hypothetical protein